MLVALGGVAASVAILAGTDAGDRTSWAKHVTGAVVLLTVTVGIGLGFTVPKLGMWALIRLGWLAPVAIVWLGVEHWLNWFAFYNPSQGKGRIVSEGDARLQGGFLIGLGALWSGLWLYLARGELRREQRTGRTG